MPIYRKIMIGLTLLWLSNFVIVAIKAQSPHDFVYTVQNGDTLTLIALRYDLNMADIALANQLPNALVFPGQSLTLPGVPLPTPTPFFSGHAPSPSITPATPSASIAESLSLNQGETYLVQTGDTLFSIANRFKISIANIMIANGLVNPDMLEVGQVLQIPNGPLPTPAALPWPFQAVEFAEPLITQGRTQVIKVTLAQTGTVSGSFEARPLLFMGAGQHWWSITAIHTLAEAGSYPLNLVATLPDGKQTSTFRNMLVISGSYRTENVQLSETESALLDPELVRVEWEKLAQLWSQVTPKPLWAGRFHYPIDPTSVYITSNFGTRRTYNNNPAISFHAGIDFGGSAGKPIYAPAGGQVVLAETLTVRGNAVLIDHGLGLFSGYWHQSKIAVQVGQTVAPGDLIGYVGSTGLSNGPHLHWEMQLNGLAVEPLQWIEEAIP